MSETRSVNRCQFCNRSHSSVAIGTHSSPVLKGGKLYLHWYECVTTRCQALCDPGEIAPAITEKPRGWAVV